MIDALKCLTYFSDDQEESDLKCSSRHCNISA